MDAYREGPFRYGLEQSSPIDRLGEIVVAAGMETSLTVARHSVGGQREDGTTIALGPQP